MKKITFLSIVAAVALAGCNNDEMMELRQDAITFDNAFVDNATRLAYDGSYTKSNLQEFQVYATISGTGQTGTGEGTANIFNAERVVRGNSLGCGINWSYSSGNTQYWIPGNNYHFIAIADGNANGVTEVNALSTDNYLPSSINLYDASAQKDILIAQHKVDNYTSPTGGISTEPVHFTFAHIMSKAKFTVKNTITTNNGYSYKVTNLKITNARKNSIYNFNNITDIVTYGTWDEVSSPSTYELSFGNVVVTGNANNANATVADIGYGASAESNYDRLLIPGTYTLNVQYDYQLLKDGTVIDTQTGKTLTTQSLTLTKGHAYNFIISLGNPGEPITFDVQTVNAWDQDLDNDPNADSDNDGNNTEDDNVNI